MSRSDSIITIYLPTGGEAPIVRRRFQGSDGPRVAIVAGIRGDTPEGMRIAYYLSQTLADFEEHLVGTVDLYPCVNPLAAEQGLRHWPFFDVDLNRMFPGKSNGHPPELVANALVKDAQHSEYVIELRGARPGFEECAQAIVTSQLACDLAMNFNVKVVWRRKPGPAAPKTFAYQFPNSIVLEGGSGNRLTDSVGDSIHNGVLNFLSHIGVLPEEKLPFSWVTIERPELVEDESVHRLRANGSGLFLPEVNLESRVEPGDLIGRIIDPSTGMLRQEIKSPISGWVMAIRHQPVVSVGIMVARIVS